MAGAAAVKQQTARKTSASGCQPDDELFSASYALDRRL